MVGLLTINHTESFCLVIMLVPFQEGLSGLLTAQRNNHRDVKLLIDPTRDEVVSGPVLAVLPP